jgi:hypothetical protein
MTPLVLEGCETQGVRVSWATISACGRYRYALGRTWDDEHDSRPIFSIIMLNPSTADGTADDPTIRKCIHFAKQEGCGSLLVRNLFAWRATDPAELRHAKDPVGPLNLSVLERDIVFGLRVAAWGQLGPKWLRRLATRSICSAKIRSTFHVLALTDHGYDRSSNFADWTTRQPRHPLYLPNATRVKTWREAETIEPTQSSRKGQDQ